MIDKWDDAVKRKNREVLIAVLREFAMTEEQATQTVDAVLKNPQKY